MLQRPGPDEFAPFYQGYVDRVPPGDVLVHLQAQGERTHSLLSALPEAKGMYCYAPGKWTVKRLVQHIVDGERLFCYRAMCIARGEQGSLPGFDENAYAELDGSDARSLALIVDEYVSVRAATVTLYRGMTDAIAARRDTANGKTVSVGALLWTTAGHELHHLAVLRERYGIG